MSIMSNRLIFISYSREDEAWKDLLEKQLSGLLQLDIKVWTDQKIGAGGDWYKEIEAALQDAWIAIVLVSDYSLTSDFILNEEVARLLQRREKEKLLIVPIIVRDCPWKLHDWLKRMQVRPKDERPLETMRTSSVRTVLKKIVFEIAEIAKATNPPDPESRLETPERAGPVTVSKPTGEGEMSLDELKARRDRLEREISERESRSSLQGSPTSAVAMRSQEGPAPSDAPSVGYQEGPATPDASSPHTTGGFSASIPEGGVNAKDK